MTIRIGVISLALATVAAGRPLGNWQAVRALPPGASITIERADGTKLKAKLIQVSEEALVVSQGTVSVNVERAAVLRIRHRRRDSILGPVVAGAALGAIPGLIFGRILAPMTSSNIQGAIVGMFCVGVGAGIGILVWAVYHPNVVIYETTAGAH